MKTARTILPLLLVSTLFLIHATTASAQLDTVYVSKPRSISGGPGSGNDWQLSFKHSGSAIASVGNITLSIDTTLFPYVRFNPNDQMLASEAKDQYQWSPNATINGDKIWWCNAFYQIPRGNGPLSKDSLFLFGLMPNPDMPNAQITDSVITIQWTAYFESNDCTTLSQLSSGSFVVIPEPWQNYYPIDTATATSSVVDCDPRFNFTMYNHNSFGGFGSIDHVIFQLLPSAPASMRPSEVQAPAGWYVQQVTQTAAYFAASTGNKAIASKASLGGFIVGLRAQPSQTPYPIPFIWSAFNGSGIIDRDTMLDTAESLRVAPCSGSNSTPDTLSVENTGDCNFNFDLANIHSGEGTGAVSRITALKLHITSPANVKWSAASLPSLCWYYSPGLGGQDLIFHASDSASCGQPGGLVQSYQVAIDDPNPGEPVTVHWVDSSGPNAISSGDVIVKCEVGATPDMVALDKLGDCCYRLRVSNVHTPPTNLHAVTLAMKAPVNGSFDPASFSSNANWAPNAGGGNTSVQFTASGGNGLQPGATDTFYFCIDPAQQGVAWPLEVVTKEAQTNRIVTDSTIQSAPGCIPPVILDSVIHTMNDTDCSDLIQITNKNATPIDRIEIVPLTSGDSVKSVTISIPWSKAISGDSAIITGSQITSAPLFFKVFYSGPATTPFAVRVRTIHNPSPVSEVDTSGLQCLALGVVEQNQAIPLDLSIAPNPLRNQTNITLTTGAKSHVSMVLLNVLGQTAKVVEGSVLQAGEYHYSLDATTLPAGTYYLRLEANGQVMTKKLVIQR